MNGLSKLLTRSLFLTAVLMFGGIFQSYAADLQMFSNAKLINTPANDGDSFLVEANGKSFRDRGRSLDYKFLNYVLCYVEFMPRKSRIDAPGALHHIIARGIERKSIFRDNKDRNNFLERLSDIIAGTETKCFAWSLMSIHLLLKIGTASISHIMRRLLTGHAVNFNRRHRRYGHLFLSEA